MRTVDQYGCFGDGRRFASLNATGWFGDILMASLNVVGVEEEMEMEMVDGGRILSLSSCSADSQVKSWSSFGCIRRDEIRDSMGVFV